MDVVGGHSPLDDATAQEILRQLPLALTVIDGAGNLRYVNDEAARVFGAPAEEMLGGPAITLTVAAADTEVAVELSATVAAGQRWVGRFPVTGPDGRRIDTWISSRSIEGDIVSVGGDVEELATSLAVRQPETLADQHRAEAEEANRLLTTLLDAVPIGMGFFDRNLRYVRVNRALAEINRLPALDHVGKSIGDVLVERPQIVEAAVQEVFEHGEIRPDQVVTDATRSAPDDLRHWVISYFPVRLRGEIAWVGTTVVEVTDWQRAERDRTALLAAERAARRRAEGVSELIMRLQVITGRLAEATSLLGVAEAIVAQAPPALGAIGGALLATEHDEAGAPVLRVIGSTGFDDEAVATFEVCRFDDDTPVSEAARTQDLVVFESRLERDRRWPSLAAVPTRSEAGAALPLVLEGRVVGAITLGWPFERRFTDDDRTFLSAISRQCALALERVRLYEAERLARAEAERATTRMTFLADASRLLGSAVDYRGTLPRLAEMAVEHIVETCAIHVSEDGELRLGGVAHRDPMRRTALQAALRRPPSNPRLIGRVEMSGRPIILEELSDEVIDSIAQDAEHAEEIRATGVRSAVVVPIVSGSQVLGVISVGSCDGPGFTGDDLAFVEDFAARVAVALERWRNDAARAEAISTLQQSLLPPVAPTITGLDLARRFHTASELDLGGDFFDVFPSGDGRWGVVMGDVCGRGVGAAALTALARYTVRAAAIDEGEPLQVLRLLNRAILDADAGERFCTLTYTIVEPTETGARVTLACGGHPLPLVLRADGTVEEVGSPGSAIGLFEDLDVTAVDLDLAPGDSIAFFTDGYTEARAPDGRFAPDLLMRTLERAAGGDAESLVSAIDAAVLAFEGGNPRDDMALLVVRVPGGSSS